MIKLISLLSDLTKMISLPSDPKQADLSAEGLTTNCLCYDTKQVDVFADWCWKSQFVCWLTLKRWFVWWVVEQKLICLPSEPRISDLFLSDTNKPIYLPSDTKQNHFCAAGFRQNKIARPLVWASQKFSYPGVPKLTSRRFSCPLTFLITKCLVDHLGCINKFQIVLNLKKQCPLVLNSDQSCVFE